MNTPCGRWPSPLSPEAVSASSLRLSDLCVDGSTLWWLEGRPAEGGRVVIVRCKDGEEPEDVLPAPWSARSLALCYGGGALTVRGGEAWFVSYGRDPALPPGDQRITHLIPGQSPTPLSEPRRWHHARCDFDPHRGRMLWLREDYERRGPENQPTLSIVATGPAGDQTLIQGRDFVGSARVSPDGRQIAWLAWDYPGMPWDSAELWLGDFDAQGAVVNRRLIAGSSTECVGQARFAPDGRLIFASDRDGWWELYALEGRSVRQLTRLRAEVCGPAWTLNQASWELLDANTAISGVNRLGVWSLCRIDLRDGRCEELPTGCTQINELVVGPGFVAFFGSGPALPNALRRVDLDSGELRLIRSATRDLSALEPYFSIPETIRFPTADGSEAHAFFYRPTHPQASPMPGERPPLLVFSHGGPTGAAHSGLSLAMQYFTSRGFAVVDVNYRGSTGYGRDYRLSLYGNWGVYDVQDCEAAARYLIARGEVDPARVMARGGSAGGYTTLALAAFTELLAGAVSWYGVANLMSIAADSDNLELHYPDLLVGRLPEDEPLFRARSPLYQAHRIQCPTLFFQGEEDPAVLPSQTRDMADALRARGVPVEAHFFAGEGHGFRRAETLRFCWERELAFYLSLPGFGR